MQAYGHCDKMVYSIRCCSKESQNTGRSIYNHTFRSHDLNKKNPQSNRLEDLYLVNGCLLQSQ